MRRQRNGTTQVWHNPDIDPLRRPGGTSGASGAPPGEADARRRSDPHRAALEALFAPRGTTPTATETRPAAAKSAGRIVLSAPSAPDAKANDRQRLLARLLGAEGRAAITKATDELRQAGHELPVTQDVCLQLLEHRDEGLVRTAIEDLQGLLAKEPPQRRTVLDSRLRRIEELAEEGATRVAATELRRSVGAARAPGRST